MSQKQTLAAVGAELTRIAAPYRKSGNVTNPLGTLVQQCCLYPNTGETRAVAALLAALSRPNTTPDLTTTRLAAFSGQTLALLAGTVASCLEGLYSREDCAKAVDFIKAHQ